ncbi:uncharacterized protein [Clytia hemisphaerica]
MWSRQLTRLCRQPPIKKGRQLVPRKEVVIRFQSYTKQNLTYSLKYILGLLGGTLTGGLSVYLISNHNVDVEASQPKKKLVILGSGWGAVSLIKSLKPDLYDIKVVSPTNYFLFTPLLPSVTVGTVDGRSLTEPIRKILSKKQKEGNYEYFEAHCIDVDTEKNQVICADKSDIQSDSPEFKIDYDILVVAVGSKTNTYNNPDIKKYSHKLKNVQQAREVRKHIVDSLETAILPGQCEEEMKRMLSFVVVGGGPTGVEFAGELRDYLDDLKNVYPQQVIDNMCITLVNSHYKVLSMYDQQISNFTEQKFKSDGINTIGNSYVVGMDPKNIKIQNKKTKEITVLPYGLCVWAAGIAPRDITKTLIKRMPAQNNRNALVTDGYMKLKGSNNIFGIGDCSTVEFTKLMYQVEQLFKEADLDGTGQLSLSEFSVFLETAKKKYPEMTQHLTKLQKSVDKTFSLMDTDHNERLSLEEFTLFLKDVDSKLKAYPATAQVASQQGKYLGKLLSAHSEITENEDFSVCKPFEYSHLGSFAYVGGEAAVLELPIIGTFTNFATIWLWRGAYLNQAVSWRMQCLIGFDWVKAHVFGRDTSEI